MKFLPLRDFDTVTNALNFSTPDYHVIGGCDVYTTKAAGADKKLYQNITNSLESQYASLVRVSASLSPPRRRSSDNDGDRKARHTSLGVPEIYLSRPSPFGSLTQISARRTYGYLIAVLNASHPDYDFTHILRPDDFRKERSLTNIMHNVNSTLANLRPRSHGLVSASILAPSLRSGAADIWSPKMWDLIDKDMGLRKCEKYSYVPDDDPFDDDEGCIWSLHYFFFNKERRRVCYLHLRGFSVISHSPVSVPTSMTQKTAGKRNNTSSVSVSDGAGKRAGYWLGSSSDVMDYCCDDDDDETVPAPDDDEVDAVPWMDLDDIRSDLAEGYFSCDPMFDEEEVHGYGCGNGWGGMRAVSEDVGEMMDF